MRRQVKILSVYKHKLLNRKRIPCLVEFRFKINEYSIWLIPNKISEDMHKFLNANTRTIGYKTYYLQKYVDRLKTFPIPHRIYLQQGIKTSFYYLNKKLFILWTKCWTNNLFNKDYIKKQIMFVILFLKVNILPFF